MLAVLNDRARRLGKNDMARFLADLLGGGGAPSDIWSIIADDVSRISDVILAQRLAERPPPPIPVAELLTDGRCSKACLLALSTEAHGCACPCAGRYHAALATAEVSCCAR